MAVYLVVLAVLLLVLFGAYRTMGGEPPTESGSVAMLGELIEQTATVSREVGGLVNADDAAAVAHAARRTLGGLDLRLEQLSLTGGDADRGERVRTAVTDLIWACKLAETGRLATDNGIAAAVEALHHNADRSLEHAAAAPAIAAG